MNVETILEGSVRADGNRLRIATQLSDATTGYQLWSERFACKLEDIFAVQDEIAAAVVRTLRVHLGDAQQATPAETTNLKVYKLYLEGRHHWNRRSEEGLLKSVACFQQALDRDADYAQAYAGLADAYVTLGVYTAPYPLAM